MRRPSSKLRANETRLLEHPDEDARVTFGHERRKVAWIDEPTRIPERGVDGAKLGGGGHVRHCEPPECGRVARAREQERLARFAVPPCTTHHLHEALDRVRVVDEADEPHVGLVDAHAERGRRDDRLRSSGHEVVLDARSLLGFEPRVVVLGPEAVAAEDASELLGRAARACVHDRGAAAQRAEPLDEDCEPIVRVRDLLDVVAQVRAHDARMDDIERPPECLADIERRLRGRRRCHPEHRRLPQGFEAAPDEEVVGTEVVAPHAHAVHLVHDHEPDPHVSEELDEARLPQALWRRVHEACRTGGDSGEPFGRLLCCERRVDEGRGGSDLRRQLVDLVLHQRNQRREHERGLGAQHRSELVGERFPRAGRHEGERVSPLDCGAYDLLLPWAERVEAEQVAKRGDELGQAREYRSPVGWPVSGQGFDAKFLAGPRGERDVEPTFEESPCVPQHHVGVVVELCDQALERARTEDTLERRSVLGYFCPLSGHLWRDLEMELDAIRTSHAEGLVGIRGRPGESSGAVRKVERVAVPLEREDLLRQACEHGVGAPGGRERDREDSHLGRRSGIHTCPEAGCEELDTEADTPVRLVCRHCLRDEALLAREPRQRRIVDGAHRPAHRDDRVELTPVGQRLALVELDAGELDAAVV